MAKLYFTLLSLGSPSLGSTGESHYLSHHNEIKCITIKLSTIVSHFLIMDAGNCVKQGEPCNTLQPHPSLIKSSISFSSFLSASISTTHWSISVTIASSSTSFSSKYSKQQHKCYFTVYSVLYLFY